MKKLVLLVVGAVVCTTAIVFLAIACVHAIKSSPSENTDSVSDSGVTIAYQELPSFPTGIGGVYAYNLGDNPEGLRPEDMVLRCWANDEATAGSYAQEGEVFDPIPGGIYCARVSASEILP
jgi:hypothetical protein